MPRSIRMLIIAPSQGEILEAAAIAYNEGAEVSINADIEAGLQELRTSGADLALIDVSLDIGAFHSQAKAERMVVPILGCGVDAPARQAVAAIRAGARDYVPLPPQRDLIVAAINSLIERPPVQLHGEDEALRKAVSLSLSVAESSAPVMFSGERGTGKTMLAHAVHEASRRSGRFVVVECSGPQDIVGSELFGHEAGAFAAARETRRGGLEKAAEGTLVLRGLENLGLENQSQLSRSLRDRSFVRIGGSERIALTARITATTAANPDEEVRAGRLRADLAEILGFVQAKLPPLRDRGSDIRLLADAFTQSYSELDSTGLRRLTEEAHRLLAGYTWPGNIRELEDLVHRAVLLSDAEAIETRHLVLADGTPLAEQPSMRSVSGQPISSLVGHTVDEVERALILETLEHCQGNRTSASNILGISVRTMRNKLRSFAEAGIPVHPAG
ncbi:hypothetical protein B5C34_08910 [Pacificimonas flava]|uniref:Sigma-54-dependent Fis family transcriptional regulator n=2 Tax=Pacificimonas TaxID=1960290 RepID=A0A219B5B1_9SPHN|nr:MULTISPECIES: sigma 54-interacting transcriptional regulator [Pacificimonas]MBZ6379213.1 sigma-54-dependent Fis family transcriptional regulator [Pacificimonas aurantium]OWV33570.1 hypothetical protein B5C34_08910 [Pacificimonas flava]